MEKSVKGAFVSFAILILGLFLSVLAGKPVAGVDTREWAFWASAAVTAAAFLITFFYYVIYEGSPVSRRKPYKNVFKV